MNTQSEVVQPVDELEQGRDYRRMQDALEWLSAHYGEQPSLAEVARHANLSEYHFQRMFRRWVGLSPKKFVQYLTLERAKRSLDANQSILDATYEAGLSSPGRLHDLFVRLEAVTPGEYKNRGAGMVVHYGFHDTPFAECLVMATERGICGLSFVIDHDRDDTLADMRDGYEKAEWRRDQTHTGSLAERVFDPVGGARKPLVARIRGTAFEFKVWEALLTIPAGTLSSYADVARRIGRPRAARAVGNAVAKNPLGYLIPCHRVIQRTGMLGQYRWGPARKLGMLSREMAHADVD